MKTLAVVLSILFISIASIAQEKYVVNNNESTLEWKGFKPGGEHTGEISIINGNVEFINNILSGGNFVIDMSSITIIDMEKQSNIDLLIMELAHEDFFNVQKFKSTTFTITKVTKSESSEFEYIITGNLKIKDISNEIRFPAKVKLENDTFHGEATITFNRQDWNLELSNFIKEMALKNDIQLKIKLIAKKL